jgi:hypothetical protein
VSDRPTRRRTREGRLKALDAFLVHVEGPLLERAERVVDVGFGLEPWTTLEWSESLHAVNAEIEVVGIERESESVAAARTHARENIRFIEGGFDAVAPLAPVSVVRAMNVLRGYPPGEIEAAHTRLAAPLVDDGLLVEGSTDTDGAVLVAHVMRKRAGVLVREELLFHTDFSRGFAPLLFRDWLPRDLRRRVVPGEPIHAFFERWTRAWQETSGPDGERFAASWRAIDGAVTDAWLLERGYALWRPAGGVPR